MEKLKLVCFELDILRYTWNAYVAFRRPLAFLQCDLDVQGIQLGFRHLLSEQLCMLPSNISLSTSHMSSKGQSFTSGKVTYVGHDTIYKRNEKILKQVASP